MLNGAINEPDKWQIDPASFIAWCASHGFVVRRQLIDKFLPQPAPTPEPNVFDTYSRIDFVNMELMKGQDVRGFELEATSWSTKKLRRVLFGDNSEYAKLEWDEHVIDHRKWEPIGLDVMVDYFFTEYEAAGRRKEFTVLNLSDAKSPSEWNVDRDSFLHWAKRHGLHLRPQLLEVIGVTPPIDIVENTEDSAMWEEIGQKKNSKEKQAVFLKYKKSTYNGVLEALIAAHPLFVMRGHTASKSPTNWAKEYTRVSSDV